MLIILLYLPIYMFFANSSARKRFKIAKILVPHDKLIYYFNLKFAEAPEGSANRLFLENVLRSLERWMINDESQEFYNPLIKIIPKDKIKPFEKNTVYTSLSPHLPLIIKGIFGLTAIIVLSYLNPNGLIKDLIDAFNSLI